MRLIPILMLALTIAACGGDNPPDGGGGSDSGNPLGPSVTPTPSTGNVSFSASAPRGWSTIDVYVDGSYAGTLRRYYDASNGPSNCTAVADARVVISVRAGSHNYTARTNLGASWAGTVSVNAGGCQETILTCPGGDCSR